MALDQVKLHDDNFYQNFNLVPPDMWQDFLQAKIVVTNWHNLAPIKESSGPKVIKKDQRVMRRFSDAYFLTSSSARAAAASARAAQRDAAALSALVRCAAVWARAALDAVLAALAAARCAAVEAVLALSSTRATNCSYCEGGSSSAPPSVGRMA